MVSARVLEPSREAVVEAAHALRAGLLVVFPTETVYGLGAHALDPSAVLRIFAAKGRPSDNPLIVHVGSVEAARALAREWPVEAQRLAEAYWPGPLTLVVPRALHVPDAVTGGLDTVALRVPAHPVALALLREADVPVAAPSANVSGRPSPTRVQDAAADLGDAVAVYLDGGGTRLGVESTVVGFREGRVVLLRSGGVAPEEIARVLGSPVERVAASESRALAPGMKYRHYAPRARVVLAHGREGVAAAVAQLVAEGLRVAVVASREHAPEGSDVRIPGGLDEPEAWSARLFALLRDLDAEGYQSIVVEAIPERGIGLAVMDRLRKAAEAAK